MATGRRSSESTSIDGTQWTVNHQQAAFPAAPGKTAFDSRYTSTPCVVSLRDRYLLYYSARDWKEDYIDTQGRKRRDYASPYVHIGVAMILKEELVRPSRFPLQVETEGEGSLADDRPDSSPG